MCVVVKWLSKDGEDTQSVVGEKKSERKRRGGRRVEMPSSAKAAEIASANPAKRHRSNVNPLLIMSTYLHTETHRLAATSRWFWSWHTKSIKVFSFAGRYDSTCGEFTGLKTRRQVNQNTKSINTLTIALTPTS